MSDRRKDYELWWRARRTSWARPRRRREIIDRLAEDPRDAEAIDELAAELERGPDGQR